MISYHERKNWQQFCCSVARTIQLDLSHCRSEIALVSQTSIFWWCIHISRTLAQRLTNVVHYASCLRYFAQLFLRLTHTMYQILLKLDLCNCVKFEIIESTAPSQLPHKQGTNFLGHPAGKFCFTKIILVVK